MSYYCKAACGTIGEAKQKCTFVCLQCKTKCSGKFASSFKDSIGKEPFYCSCNKSNLNNIVITHECDTKRRKIGNNIPVPSTICINQ